MFDKLTLIKPALSETEIELLVWRNGLQINTKDGVVFYDNLSTKNLSQQKGMFIRIETNRKLTVEGSLHKFYNELQGGIRDNSNLFYMSEAKQAIDALLIEKGIPPDGLRLSGYEIGLNLNVSKDCSAFMGKMKSIGAAGNEKRIYVNPRYKDERGKATEFPTHTRKYFKAYDKVFEMKDKKRKNVPTGNILRIETVYRRLDKVMVTDFFSTDNLTKILETFFRDWRTIQFTQDITTPKGTGRAKRYLCVEIIEKGTDAVLQNAKESHKNGSLTDKEYRNIREFIAREWNEFKKRITFIASDEELEYRQLLNTNYLLLKNDLLVNLLKNGK